jgi:hypothetical protein
MNTRVGLVQPVFFLKLNPGLAFYFAITIATIDCFPAARFEWYLGILPTLSAYRRVHLAFSAAIRSPAAPRCFPCLTAGRATLRLIGVTLGLIELLFAAGKGEAGPTIGTS